jgi:hypothetical protein
MRLLLSNSIVKQRVFVSSLAAFSLFSFARSLSTMSSTSVPSTAADPHYPGTAVGRLQEIHRRLAALPDDALSSDWATTRRHILHAGGLQDNDDRSRIGTGYTGHAFNDYNHCDLTPMRLASADSKNDGSVVGIAIGNALGDGIRAASIPFDNVEDDGGSWSTCMLQCNKSPPADVAHIQFQSRIAFKLVWCPPHFTSLVLVDDDGKLLKAGTPTGQLPALRERQLNYQIVQGSKYATAAEAKEVEITSDGN